MNEDQIINNEGASETPSFDFYNINGYEYSAEELKSAGWNDEGLNKLKNIYEINGTLYSKSELLGSGKWNEEGISKLSPALYKFKLPEAPKPLPSTETGGDLYEPTFAEETSRQWDNLIENQLPATVKKTKMLLDRINRYLPVIGGMPGQALMTYSLPENAYATLADGLKKEIDTIEEKSAKQTAGNTLTYDDVDSVSDFASLVVNNTIVSSPYMVSAMVPYAGVALTGSMAAGDVQYEKIKALEQEGYDVREMYDGWQTDPMSSVAFGLTIGALERIGLKGILGSVAGKGVARGVFKRTLDVATAALKEGITEVGQETIQSVGSRATAGLDPIENNLGKRLFDAFTIGATVGGAMSTAGNTAGYAKDKIFGVSEPKIDQSQITQQALSQAATASSTIDQTLTTEYERIKNELSTGNAEVDNEVDAITRDIDKELFSIFANDEELSNDKEAIDALSFDIEEGFSDIPTNVSIDEKSINDKLDKLFDEFTKKGFPEEQAIHLSLASISEEERQVLRDSRNNKSNNEQQATTEVSIPSETTVQARNEVEAVEEVSAQPERILPSGGEVKPVAPKTKKNNKKTSIKPNPIVDSNETGIDSIPIEDRVIVVNEEPKEETNPVIETKVKQPITKKRAGVLGIKIREKLDSGEAYGDLSQENLDFDGDNLVVNSSPIDDTDPTSLKNEAKNDIKYLSEQELDEDSGYELIKGFHNKEISEVSSAIKEKNLGRAVEILDDLSDSDYKNPKFNSFVEELYDKVASVESKLVRAEEAKNKMSRKLSETDTRQKKVSDVFKEIGLKSKYNNLLKWADKNGVEITIQDSDEDYEARVNPSSEKVIEINSRTINDKDLDRIIAEEILHSAVINGSKNKGVTKELKSDIDNWTKSVRDSVKSMDSVPEEFAFMIDESEANTEWGFTEIIAKSFTNPEIAKFLDSIPFEKNEVSVEAKRTLWDKAKEIIRRLIGSDAILRTQLDELTSIVNNRLEKSVDLKSEESEATGIGNARRKINELAESDNITDSKESSKLLGFFDSINDLSRRVANGEEVKYKELNSLDKAVSLAKSNVPQSSDNIGKILSVYNDIDTAIGRLSRTKEMRMAKDKYAKSQSSKKKVLADIQAKFDNALSPSLLKQFNEDVDKASADFKFTELQKNNLKNTGNLKGHSKEKRRQLMASVQTDLIIKQTDNSYDTGDTMFDDDFLNSRKPKTSRVGKIVESMNKLGLTSRQQAREAFDRLNEKLPKGSKVTNYEFESAWNSYSNVNSFEDLDTIEDNLKAIKEKAKSKVKSLPNAKKPVAESLLKMESHILTKEMSTELANLVKSFEKNISSIEKVIYEYKRLRSEWLAKNKGVVDKEVNKDDAESSKKKARFDILSKAQPYLEILKKSKFDHNSFHGKGILDLININTEDLDISNLAKWKKGLIHAYLYGIFSEDAAQALTYSDFQGKMKEIKTHESYDFATVVLPEAKNSAQIVNDIAKFANKVGNTLFSVFYYDIMKASADAETARDKVIKKLNEIAVKNKLTSENFYKIGYLMSILDTTDMDSFDNWYNQVEANRDFFTKALENKFQAMITQTLSVQTEEDVNKERAILGEITNQLKKTSFDENLNRILSKGELELYNEMKNYTSVMSERLNGVTNAYWNQKFINRPYYFPREVMGSIGELGVPSKSDSFEYMLEPGIKNGDPDSQNSNITPEKIAEAQMYSKISDNSKNRKHSDKVYYDMNMMRIIDSYAKETEFNTKAVRHIKSLSRFLNSNEAKKIVGADNSKKVKRAVKSNLKRIIGARESLPKAMRRLEWLGNRAMTAVLGNATQIFKQAFTMMLPTLIQNPKGGLPAVQELYKYYSTNGKNGFGGEKTFDDWLTKYGAGIQVRDRLMEKFEDDASVYNPNKFNRAMKKAEGLTSYVLTKSDKLSARLTFLSAFLNAGGDINNPTREALIEAEKKTILLQNVNNINFAPEYFAGDTTLKRFFASTVLLFKSFALNQSLNTLKSIQYSFRKDSGYAKSYLASSLVSALSYQYISASLNWIIGNSSSLFSEALGMSSGGDEDDLEMDQEALKGLARAVGDITFGGIPIASELIPMVIERGNKSLNIARKGSYNYDDDGLMRLERNPMEVFFRSTGKYGMVLSEGTDMIFAALDEYDESVMGKNVSDKVYENELLHRMILSTLTFAPVIPFRGDMLVLARSLIRDINKDASDKGINLGLRENTKAGGRGLYSR